MQSTRATREHVVSGAGSDGPEHSFLWPGVSVAIWHELVAPRVGGTPVRLVHPRDPRSQRDRDPRHLPLTVCTIVHLSLPVHSYTARQKTWASHQRLPRTRHYGSSPNGSHSDENASQNAPQIPAAFRIVLDALGTFHTPSEDTYRGSPSLRLARCSLLSTTV